MNTPHYTASPHKPDNTLPHYGVKGEERCCFNRPLANNCLVLNPCVAARRNAKIIATLTCSLR